MRFFSPSAKAAPDTESVLELWFAQSQRSGWTRESDWFCSAARSVASMLSAGKEPSAAFRSLASRRAVQGAGIAESLTDAQALFTVFPHPQSSRLLVEFAAAWVEATDLFSHRLTCTDANSGLSNRQHFERRVHELRENPLTRTTPHLLALYRHQRADLDDMTTFMMAADIGQACTGSLPEAVATYRGDRMALLLPRASDSRTRLDRLGTALSAVLEDHGIPGSSLRLDLEPVPFTTHGIQRLLGSLWT